MGAKATDIAGFVRACSVRSGSPEAAFQKRSSFIEDETRVPPSGAKVIEVISKLGPRNVRRASPETVFPQACGLVPRCGGEGASVGREGHRRYRGPMTLQNAQRLAGYGIP